VFELKSENWALKIFPKFTQCVKNSESKEFSVPISSCIAVNTSPIHCYRVLEIQGARGGRGPLSSEAVPLDSKKNGIEGGLILQPLLSILFCL